MAYSDVVKFKIYQQRNEKGTLQYGISVLMSDGETDKCYGDDGNLMLFTDRGIAIQKLNKLNKNI